MAVGNYGITRPADVSIEDIDVFYSYVGDRGSFARNMTKIEDVTEVLDYCYIGDFEDNEDESGGLLEGMYNLKLPTTIFDEVGIYTLYLRPKTIEVDIIECSTLTTLPNIIGLVIKKEGLSEELIANNGLQGYRVEYRDDDEKKRNIVRYVVSSNSVSIESNNLGTANQNANTYSFNNEGEFVFLQLTPSSTFDVKPNQRPYIGNAGETILLSNTHFSPVMVEIELVEDTIETLTDLVAGEQVKDVENSIVSYYDRDRNITKQFDLYQIKSEIDGELLYEVKEKRDNIKGELSIEDIAMEE